MEDSWKSYEIQGEFTRCRKKIQKCLPHMESSYRQVNYNNKRTPVDNIFLHYKVYFQRNQNMPLCIIEVLGRNTYFTCTCIILTVIFPGLSSQRSPLKQTFSSLTCQSKCIVAEEISKQKNQILLNKKIFMSETLVVSRQTQYFNKIKKSEILLTLYTYIYTR